MRVIIMPSCYLKPELTVARIAQHGSVSAEMMFVICLHKKGFRITIMIRFVLWRAHPMPPVGRLGFFFGLRAVIRREH